MPVKHRVTVNLEALEYHELQKLANKTDRSLAWLARRAICDFLQHTRKADKLSLGAIAETASNEGNKTQ